MTRIKSQEMKAILTMNSLNFIKWTFNGPLSTAVVTIFRLGGPTVLNELKRRIRLCFGVEVNKSQPLKYVTKLFSI